MPGDLVQSRESIVNPRPIPKSGQQKDRLSLDPYLREIVLGDFLQGVNLLGAAEIPEPRRG